MSFLFVNRLISCLIALLFLGLDSLLLVVLGSCYRRKVKCSMIVEIYHRTHCHTDQTDKLHLNLYSLNFYLIYELVRGPEQMYFVSISQDSPDEGPVKK